MPMIRSIVFVCWGNICRSPAAENVMRKMLEDAGLDQEIRCDSAGTIDMHRGHPPDPRMTEAGRRRGLAMTGSARKARRSDFENFDLIIAMDKTNREDLHWLNPEGQVELFGSYCQNHDVEEVPDPYYGGDKGFEYVLDLLEDGCAQLLKMLREQRKT